MPGVNDVKSIVNASWLACLPPFVAKVRPYLFEKLLLGFLKEKLGLVGR